MDDKCPRCGMDVSTPALKFLHEQAHAEPWRWTGDSLGSLAFVLYPRVAKLMEDFAALNKPAE